MLINSALLKLQRTKTLASGSSPRKSFKYSTSKKDWCWQGAAGWPYAWEAQCGYLFPYVFQNLPGLLYYCELGVTGGGFQVYTLNGVSQSIAMCAVSSGNNQIDDNPGFFLYLAPNHASQGWYYLLNYFGISPPINTGPVTSASDAIKLGAQFVSVTSGGDPAGGAIQFCGPSSFGGQVSTSKLTLVG
jgi:hypothetical protein